MAFCNSCGTTITPGSRFCNQCGAPILASTLPPPAAPASATVPPVPIPPAAGVAARHPPQGGALKIILIAVGVIVLLGAISLASLAFFTYRFARHAHVQTDGGNAKIETPFGNIETTKDPAEAVRNIGVDLYPGAEVQDHGSASATIGGMHTATLVAESSDSVDKVAEFYKAKFPKAAVTTCEADRCTIVSNEHGSIVTINLQAEGDRTKIQISSVIRK
jgi:hypothetical protein